MPFVRERISDPDVRVGVAAMSLLGVLCEIPNPVVGELVKAYLPYIFKSLDRSSPVARREAALYLVDQVPKHHVGAFFAGPIDEEVVPGELAKNPHLETLLDCMLESLRDASPFIVQRAIFAFVNLVSSLPMAQNLILARRYQEVFDAALDILKRPPDSVYPEIIFAVDDLIGLLIIHSADSEFSFIADRAEQMAKLLEAQLSTAEIAPADPLSDTSTKVWELSYDQDTLRGPEESVYAHEDLVDRVRRAIASVISSALSSTLQRLPPPMLSSFDKLYPLAIRALAQWGFSDDLLALVWHLFELLPASVFSAYAESFKAAAQKCFGDSSLVDACDAARSLADLCRTFPDPDLKAMLDVEWTIPALLQKNSTVTRLPVSASGLAERASVQRTLAALATTLGAKSSPYIPTLRQLLEVDMLLVHDPAVCSLEHQHISPALMDLTYSVCTSLSALLMLIEREAPECKSASLEELVAEFCVSFYKVNLQPEDQQSRVPIAFRRDPEALETLDRKVLLLARTLRLSCGDERSRQLMPKALCDDVSAAELDPDALIDDIVELAAI